MYFGYINKKKDKLKLKLFIIVLFIDNFINVLVFDVYDIVLLVYLNNWYDNNINVLKFIFFV